MGAVFEYIDLDSGLQGGGLALRESLSGGIDTYYLEACGQGEPPPVSRCQLYPDYGISCLPSCPISRPDRGDTPRFRVLEAVRRSSEIDVLKN